MGPRSKNMQITKQLFFSQNGKTQTDFSHDNSIITEQKYEHQLNTKFFNLNLNEHTRNKS